MERFAELTAKVEAVVEGQRHAVCDGGEFDALQPTTVSADGSALEPEFDTIPFSTCRKSYGRKPSARTGHALLSYLNECRFVSKSRSFLPFRQSEPVVVSTAQSDGT